jgi:AraC-like DNA-binding protein
MQDTDIDESDRSDRRGALELSSERPSALAGPPTQRGPRAARTASVIAAIDSGFSDPHFSTRILAARLGLSVRYVQDLAKDSGFSITERIVALRLQKAHAILIDDHGCLRKISDVASSCGFNEVSHFHRCFRRRFGAAPAQLRAKAAAK